MGKQYKNIQDAIDKMSPYDRRNGYYVEVFYDMSEDAVYSHAQCSLGFNSWTEYYDSDVIKIGNFVKKVSKKRLIEIIEERIKQDKEWGEWKEWLEGGMQYAD